MDPESLAASTAAAAKATRKVRFVPKAPPGRAQKLVLPKPEKVEDDVDAVKAEELLRRFNESSIRTVRSDKKGSIKFVSGPSTSSRTFVPPKGANKLQSSSSYGGNAEQNPEKEYKEPWDYYTYYPTTHPLRRPYSGNPEVLDEKEFGEISQSSIYDENSTNPAAELGLFEEALEDNLFFFQLPSHLPLLKQQENAEGSEAANNPKALKGRPCKFDDLSGGFLGKMLVYKSGAIKMKLGETLYDVSPGMDCVFSQDVVAMNTQEKHCCNIGELNKRVVVTPDIDYILESVPNL